MELLVTVSIDTEEDNWTPTRTGTTVSNIRELARLSEFFSSLGVRATYFTTYPVIACSWAAEILRDIQSTGQAEIAAHVHPWNTPPVEEDSAARNTMLKNLPAPLQLAKIRTITESIQATLGTKPSTFRAGRWGFGSDTVTALLECGYQVDSSVTPFVNWESVDEGPSYLRAPPTVYRLSGNSDPAVPAADGRLVEVPVSCGYNRRPFWLWSSVHRFLTARGTRALRLAGLAHTTGLVRRVILSPEQASTEDMVSLSRCLADEGHRLLHLYWHSPSLRPGLSPHTQTSADVERLYGSITDLLDILAARAHLRFVTVAEAAQLLAPPLQAGTP